MSWSFDTVGKHADVCAEVAAISSVPQEIKDIVAKFAGKNPPQGYHNGIRVKSSGHNYQVIELRTDTTHIAPTAPVVQVEPPPQPQTSPTPGEPSIP